ncbi:hypothetical protein BC831DRAFT_511239 [Entophlyctis helioformis]|nr:hypothetical protein BC831DRAFT_511239 [Entophlyctis helioformis]
MADAPALLCTPLTIHRAHNDTVTHGCPHLGLLKTTPVPASGGSPASSAAAELFEAYRCCVRYSLTYRSRFQLHIHKKGKEFRAMVAVDDDEAAAQAAQSAHGGSSVAAAAASAAAAGPGSASSSTAGPASAGHVEGSTSGGPASGGAPATGSATPLSATDASAAAASAVRKRKRPTNNTAIERIIHAADKLPTPVCCVCDDFMSASRLHACLQCVFLGCWKDKHIHAHMASRSHTFAMDFVHCSVYCAKCKDYVYDLDLEHVLNAEKSRIDMLIARVKEPNLRRITYQEWSPSPAEVSQIQKHSRLQPCSGLRGLRNMGSTCFMNTILQTLIHNPLLRAHFLSDKHDRDLCRPNSGGGSGSPLPCLACEMDSLFRNFYNGKTTPYGPASFLHAMWISQKHLAGYQQQDAHEFFISVLNEIHNSCSGGPVGTSSHGHDSLQQCKCIVHQVFGGVLQSDVTCLKCGNVTTASDPILDLSLDIKAGARPATQKKAVKRASGVGTAASASLGGGGGDDIDEKSRASQPYSLTECLDGFTLPERLGTNQYTCAACGNTFQEATKQLSMKRLPPVLAIQLKRFEHSATSSTKIDTFVRVPAELDMTPHTTRSVKLRAKLRAARKDANRKIPLRGIAGFDTITDGIPTYKYSLFAIVNHEGKMDTGHYKAYAKCRGHWFLFDDHTVTITTQKAALESNGYMCFYIRDNVEYAPSSVSEVLMSPGAPSGTRQSSLDDGV